MKFDGKITLVTGAASGIGLVTAQRFAELGASVVLSDIQRDKGEAAAEELKAAGRSATFVYADVSDQESVVQLMSTIRERYGRLDFAFNNAGIEGQFAPIDQIGVDNWHRVISINLDSVFYCMREQVPLMRDSGGVIINCSSIAGLVGTNGGSAYAASKHGVIGITRAAALDLARQNIRVNAICPGAVDTPMVQRSFEDNPSARNLVEEMQPIGRMAKPEEVAAAVMWLCDDEAAVVTGIALPIDGAWTAH